MRNHIVLLLGGTLLFGCRPDSLLFGCRPDNLLNHVIRQAFYPEIGYKVYYGSLHNHSNISDGLGSPSKAYVYARDTAGLDFFGLTDHANMISNSEWFSLKSTANSYNQNDVYVTFWGFEWSSNSNYGHVAVINTSDYTTAYTPSTNTFLKLDRWLSSRNSVAFLNHPGREDMGQEFTHFTHPASDKIVGMELFNKNVGFSKYYYNNGYYDNDGDLGYFDEALKRGWKIGAAGSEDNHSATWGTATDFRHAILANSLTRAELLAAIKARRFFSTLDKNISLSFKIDGNEMGSTISAGTYTVRIFAVDEDGEIVSEVLLMKNGAVDQTWAPQKANPNLSFSLTVSNGEYYYVLVRQNDGDEAISSPIWITDAAE